MNDYYTVSEYAMITGKDTGNIRRLLLKGEIPGEKMGNQWIIPKGTEYPDRRFKTGKYVSWRKKYSFNKTNPELMKALTEMSDQLYKIFGDIMEKVVLYGSYARNEQTAESDVDVAVFLKQDSSEEMHDKMIDLVVDYELELDLTLSVIPIEFDQYKKWKGTLPFYKNIDKEGILIWKAA